MQEKIELEVKLESLDFQRFYIYNYLNFNTGFYIFFGLVLFGMTLLFLALGNTFEFAHLISLFVLSFAFTLIFIFFLIYAAAKNAVRDNKWAKILISSENITVIAENYTSEIKWAYFTQIVEEKNHFFLTMKDGHPMMIPKRNFTNKEDILIFRELLRTEFEDKASLQKSDRKLGLK